MSNSEFVELVLDLASFDAVRARIAAYEQEARGIKFVTLAEEQARHPEELWLGELTDLENATRAHLGEPPRTPAQMRERLAFLRVAPEALFIARLGERYVGYSCLNVLDAADGTVPQGWTGVRPEMRRQGLATALKLIAAADAKARGYLRIVTAPRRGNARAADAAYNRASSREARPAQGAPPARAQPGQRGRDGRGEESRDASTCNVGSLTWIEYSFSAMLE